ncbi:MAG: NUDIX domain-containing protein [Gammaproteobacteria bacterium]|nr:NUDIX domain-containing protein [Gammaproteobacteria bacterium]
MTERFDQRDCEVLSRTVRYDGFFKIHALDLRHRRFAGDWTPAFSRELFVRDDATCVLPYDPVQDAIVLIEQFRVGALGRDQSPWLLELVAGINEPGETPEAVAHREADEEAGLALRALEPICRYLVSPGGSSECVHLYCAWVDAPAQSGTLHGLADEHEDIRVHVLSWQDAWSSLCDGLINNAASIIALQWLALHRERLRAQWLPVPTFGEDA